MPAPFSVVQSCEEADPGENRGGRASLLGSRWGLIWLCMLSLTLLRLMVSCSSVGTRHARPRRQADVLVQD